MYVHQLILNASVHSYSALSSTSTYIQCNIVSISRAASQRRRRRRKRRPIEKVDGILGEGGGGGEHDIGLSGEGRTKGCLCKRSSSTGYGVECVMKEGIITALYCFLITPRLLHVLWAWRKLCNSRPRKIGKLQKTTLSMH